MEFADNPEPRCPCVLLLDTSISMNQNDAIGALNQGIQTFKGELEKDTLAALRVEIAIITFGKGVEVAQDFVTVDRFDPPSLSADGPSTPMSQGIETAARPHRKTQTKVQRQRSRILQALGLHDNGRRADRRNARNGGRRH